MIKINRDRVERLAETMRELPVAPDFPEQVTPRINTNDEAAYRAFLWSAAICHATKGGLRGEYHGKRYKGWDYLLRAFCYEAEQDASAVSPDRISDLSAEALHDLLHAHACHPTVTLSDLERRAEILRECAEDLDQHYAGSVEQLLSGCDGCVGGEDGAYARLSLLRAFQDDLQKKSSAFLMTVHFSRRWTIRDHEHVVPMIDYHRMRLLMRTGCVEISEPEFQLALARQVQVDREAEARIRKASSDICVDVVKLSGMPMFDFDVLLWAHARSCCRHKPICVSGEVENDSFYDLLSKAQSGRSCVFGEWCPGKNQDVYRALWEPIVSTEHY